MRPEDALQSEVATWLNAHMPSASWWTATANGAFLGGDKRRRIIQAARLKRTGVKPGTPDIIICHEGRFLAIEMKCEGECLSDVQMEVEDSIAIAGGGFAVCRSLLDVKETLAGWGVPYRGSAA